MTEPELKTVSFCSKIFLFQSANSLVAHYLPVVPKSVSNNIDVIFFFTPLRHSGNLSMGIFNAPNW